MNDIKIAIAVLNKLETFNRRTDKEKLLTKFVGNKILRTMFLMAFGTDRYFVKPEKQYNFIANPLSYNEAWTAFCSLTTDLKNRSITGKAAKKSVDELLKKSPPPLTKWCIRILLRDLRVGIKETVKLIWEDLFIPKGAMVFAGCALAKKYSDIKKNKLTWPMAGEPKFDGERALVFVDRKEQVVKIFTRSGKRRKAIEQVDDFVSQLFTLTDALKVDKVFFDGEFLANGWNSTSKIIRKTKNFDPVTFLKNIRMFIWDWLPYDNYINKSGLIGLTWKERKEALQIAVSVSDYRKSKIISPNIVVIGHRILKSEKATYIYYNHLLNRGFEGIVIKNMNALYTTKRSASLLKLKPEDENTATIVSLEPGKGKHGAAPQETIQKVLALLCKSGTLSRDELYIKCTTDKDVDRITKTLKLIGDSTDRRISINNNTILFRYGARLGYIKAITKKGEYIRIGGGLKDLDRNRFWKKRNELIGMKVDYISQSDPEQVAIARFNRFVRLREDLT